MDTDWKLILRAFWPQWVPAVACAGFSGYVLWGLPLSLVVSLSAIVGVGVFFFMAFISMALIWD